MKYILFSVFILIQAINLFSEDENEAINFYDQGEQNLNEGLYVLALENYKKALEKNPYYKEALLGIGDVYFYTNQYDSAIEYYNKALELDPNFLAAIFKIAKFYDLQDNYDSALKYYEKIKEYDEANFECLQSLAGIYIKKNILKKAEETLTTLRKLAPTYIWYIYRTAEYYEKENKIDSAIIEYNKILKITPPPISDVYFKLANIYFKRNNIEEVESIFLKAIKDKNSEYKAKTYLTKLYLLKQNYSAANSLWLKEPEDSINNYHLGLANYNIAEAMEGSEELNDKKVIYEKALSYFLSALKYDSNDELILEHLKRILIKIDKVNTKRRKDLANTFLIYANNYYYTKGKTNLAIRMYEEAKKIDPQNSQIRFQLAKLYHYLKYNISAQKELEKAKELEPQNVEISDLYLILNNFNSNDQLAKYEYEPNKKRYNITLSVQTNYLDVEHIDLSDISKNIFEQLLSISNKFNLIILPDYYKTLEDIEQVSKNFNADAIIILQMEESNNTISAKMDLYSITSHNNKADYGRDRIQRAKYVKYDKFSFIRKDKEKYYEILNSISEKIINYFPSAGEIQEIKENDLLVNLGIRQGLQKNQELIVYSQTLDSENVIGKIKVKELNEFFSICEITDPKILKFLKLLDIVVKTK
ncbi:MAG TPA: tetratricopeptide repeat protein [bacterium]|nr:tetratricopeptide repeat protein [bacterium]HOL47987.1 tetratricopeptide repeat protein [bacterium]HPQ19201.1 tetratricopeptide repeat protein [bacterium]